MFPQIEATTAMFFFSVFKSCLIGAFDLMSVICFLVTPFGQTEGYPGILLTTTLKKESHGKWLAKLLNFYEGTGLQGTHFLVSGYS